MRIRHVINDLEAAGAQTMLAKLLEAGGEGLEQEVVSVQPGGALRDRAEAAAPVVDLGARGAKDAPKAAWGLARRASGARPDLIMGWMYHGYAAASLAWLFDRCRAPLLFNIRHSVHDIAHETRAIRLLIAYGARLSARAAAVIYNARTSADQHEALGFDPRKRAVIPNGFDCGRFRPDPARRGAMRARWGIEEDTILFGKVARLHPMKNHLGLLRAFEKLLAREPRARLALVGRGADDASGAVAQAAGRGALQGKVLLLGESAATHELYPAFDVAVLASSWGEGFPNVLGEAMASGVPCVATDVGDAAWVIGDTGFVAPADDEAALEAALHRMTALGAEGRAALAATARQRVVERFALGEIARAYRELYARILDERRTAKAA